MAHTSISIFLRASDCPGMWNSMSLSVLHEGSRTVFTEPCQGFNQSDVGINEWVRHRALREECEKV